MYLITIYMILYVHLNEMYIYLNYDLIYIFIYDFGQFYYALISNIQPIRVIHWNRN